MDRSRETVVPEGGGVSGAMCSTDYYYVGARGVVWWWLALVETGKSSDSYNQNRICDRYAVRPADSQKMPPYIL